jgi:MoaA/NifB/PqqE/SkfB family radical SAM enzyme
MKCPLRCEYCVNSFDKKFDRIKYDELDGKTWVNALNRLEFPENVPLSMCGGEPGIYKDFIYLLNNLREDIKVDILTNLIWSPTTLDRFINEVNPARFKRPKNFSSIRVSFHPTQMNIEEQCKKAVKIQNAGFSIGIAGVLFPENTHLNEIIKARFICKKYDIDYEIKGFTGMWKGMLYGNYETYPDASFQNVAQKVKCKIKELLISSDGRIYKCHHDLYAQENSISNITDSDLKIEDIYRECDKYGKFCHPCDVKTKTDFKMNLGYTSVDIIKEEKQ